MLIDNKVDRYPNDGFDIKTVWDFINEFSGKESQQTGNLDIVTGYFTIRALSKLYHDIPEEDNFRIVSSELVKPEEDDSHVIDLLNGDAGIQTSLKIDKYAEDAKAFLRRNTVQIKAIVNAFCHAKAYMFKNNNPRQDSYYLTGSSNLTDAGLGLKKTSNIELTMGDPVKQNNKDYQEVCSWFEDIWKEATNEIADPDNPKGPKITVKDYFVKLIDEYFRKYTPLEIYYKILFELFNSDIEQDGGIEHKQDMSLLQTSVIWKTLFNYQQKGVISLIKMLRKYNGAILADAVGLGKTFSALAVIKYFQTQGYLTVLLCPKKLEENWTQYLKRRGSRFEKDEFDYVVRFHSDLQNERMQNSYQEAPLSYLQNNKKVLLVIDESHNLRNEKSNRYQELLTNLIQNQPNVEGRDVKVLMLSATPINTGLNDVKGQFNLIGKGNDSAFDNEEFGISSLRNLFKDSQTKYRQWCNQPDRTIGSFISMLPPRFFNLTDKLIVARTRKLIENTLHENLGFPEKATPINVYQGVDHFGKFRSTEEIYKAFEELNLTAYQPSLFLHESRKEARKEASSDWNDDVNREMFLVKMMGILFMKRLESSWYSCLQTVKKVLDVHEQTLKMVLDFEEKKSNGTLPTGVEVADDDDEMEEQFALRKGSIRLSEMKNLGGFKRGLQTDVNKLRAIYESLEAFEQDYRNGFEQDLKLEELIKILEEKRHSKNKKVVIFTAYADTAKFIFDELKKRGFTKMASASGQEVCTTGGHSTVKFTPILQSFAPYSKLFKELDWSDLYEDAKLSRAEYYDDAKQQWKVNDYNLWEKLVRQYRPLVAKQLDDNIEILIATDCLSEGQNLQDADMQVNYDIHWNPVRLIQRFGRIDRIGSPNKVVHCVNFWPAESFEEYLHLEKRIIDRMTIMNIAGSETQIVNEQYKQMVDDNPLADKNARRLLSELQNNSISEIESNQSLSLKDFSFEVYRQDLVAYLEQNKDFFRKMPNGVFSGFHPGTDVFEHIPESLVAVVGFPHREEGSTKPYTEIYLMCQPVDTSLAPHYQKLNRAEILEFLRQNKEENRYVPEWIETNDSERLSKLTEIMQMWMKNKVPQQATSAILQLAQARRTVAKPSAKEKNTQLLEEKFKLENFDLIVWEYISK
ncbi:helicase-related protein [uncultured Prevotella sp.]|uniref:helicase-related protein n=1 Tax=uncultured Prevotella sp. TaxID=159272 RepID=UPI00258E63DF|nr:helicase-related protein [uncultured Prevotella sp.]